MRRATTIAAALLCTGGVADACESWTLGAGLAALIPRGGATRADVRIAPNLAVFPAGPPRAFTISGLSADPESARTLALSLGCEWSPAWALHLDAGVPPRVAVSGSGVLAPPGPTSGLLRLDLDEALPRSAVDARVWSPVLAMRYRFGPADAPARPFVSVGVGATWFTGERVRPGFDAAIDARFGQPLALAQLRPGRTRTRFELEPAWAPVLGGGIEWRLAPRWRLHASLGYSPVRVRARFRTLAADGERLAGARSRSDLEVVGAAALLSRSWGDPPAREH